MPHDRRLNAMIVVVLALIGLGCHRQKAEAPAEEYAPAPTWRMMVHDGPVGERSGTSTAYPTMAMSDEKITELYVSNMLGQGRVIDGRRSKGRKTEDRFYAELASGPYPIALAARATGEGSDRPVMYVTLGSTPYGVQAASLGGYFWAPASSACKMDRARRSELFDTREAACRSLSETMTSRTRELEALVAGLAIDGLRPFGSPAPGHTPGPRPARATRSFSAVVTINTTSPADNPVTTSVTPFDPHASDADVVHVLAEAIRTHWELFCIAPDERGYLFEISATQGGTMPIDPIKMETGEVTFTTCTKYCTVFVCVDDQGQYGIATWQSTDSRERYLEAEFFDSSRDQVIAELAMCYWRDIKFFLSREGASSEAARARWDAAAKECFPRLEGRVNGRFF